MSKKILAMLLCVCMVMSLAMPTFAADFTDTDSHWAEAAIDRWVEHGLVEGVGGDKFDPNGSMTRGQAAALFARLLKLEAKADISNFEDVNPDAWYAEYIAMCVEAGIMNGVGDNMMDPGGTLSREQMMTMLCRALGIRPEESCDKDFDDSDEVSAWAEGYVNALINAGIVSGLTEDTLAPDVDINRASMMALLDKGIVVYADEEGETVSVGEGTGIVVIVADNVTVENAPVGTVVVTGAETTGTEVNGTEVDKDTIHEVEPTPEPEPEPEPEPDKPVIIPHFHRYDNWVSNNDGTHTGTCVCMVEKTEDCGDWIEGAVCEVCGYNKDAEAVVGDKYTTLAEAIAIGGEVLLLKDVNLTKTVKVEAGKTVTLDLNGKTIDAIGNTRIAIMSYGNLTLKDSSAEQTGTIKAGKSYDNGTPGGNTINVCAGTFTMESGNIYSQNNGILIDEEAATVTINGGTITAEPTTDNSAAFYISSTSDTQLTITGGEMVGFNGILLWNNTKIDISGGSIKAENDLGIQGNGSNDNTEINISGDASIYGKEAAIYHPQGGKLNISGNASLTGGTGIVVKGGNVNISGGTVTANGEAADYEPTGNGFNATGDALYVEVFDNSTSSENYGTPVVTVTGGTFTSVNGKAVASYANTSNGVTALTKFISGGTFSSDPGACVAYGYKAAEADGAWTVKQLEVVDGVIYDEDLLYGVTPDFEGTTLKVREGTTAIGGYAFAYNSDIETIVLPSTVTTLKDRAFRDTSASTVVLNEGLTNISYQAFRNAYNVKSVAIPSTVTTISKEAFQSSGIETLTIPATVTTIEYGGCRDMKELETVTIEGNVEIPVYAFRACTNLKTVYLNGDDVTFAGKGMIFTNKENGDGSAITVYVKNETVKERLLANDTAAKDYGGYKIVVATEVKEGILKHADSNTYDITSKEGLMNLQSLLSGIYTGEGVTATINLCCDVDLAGETWKPIEAMWVTFDGNGHTISNLTAGFDTAERRSGFWSYAGAVTIKNLTLNNVTVSGSQAGTFAGAAEGLTVTDCVLTGTNTVNFVSRVETWNGIGAITGVLVGSNINVEIAEGATVTLNKGAMTTDPGCTYIDDLTGYISANNGTVTNKGTVTVQ